MIPAPLKQPYHRRANQIGLDQHGQRALMLNTVIGCPYNLLTTVGTGNRILHRITYVSLLCSDGILGTQAKRIGIRTCQIRSGFFQLCIYCSDIFIITAPRINPSTLACSAPKDITIFLSISLGSRFTLSSGLSRESLTNCFPS